MPIMLDAAVHSPEARAHVLPVMFVVDDNASALEWLVSDLSRRFGNDFAVRGTTSPEEALRTLTELAAEQRPVALLLVADTASEAFLARAHELHPHAKRVLLVDRDYSATSPAVQAMTLGRVDYHIVRPWSSDETMYRTMSDYLASWTRQQEPSIRGVSADRRRARQSSTPAA